MAIDHINHPIFDDLYHPFMAFMVIWGMVHGSVLTALLLSGKTSENHDKSW